MTGLAAHSLFDLTTLEGLLLGAVIASTDSAAIFSVLRGSSIERKLARTLEAESGFNDPVAVLLVLGFIEWIQTPDYGIADMALLVVEQLSIGALVGFAVGTGAVLAFRKAQFSTTGLYPVASIATAALAFGAADELGGSGFLAVYLAGLSLGSGRIPARRTIEDFHAGLAWVSQIALFFTLGLLVFPSELDDVALDGVLLAVVLTLVARPIATFLTTAPFGYSPREMTLLSWAGLRGALPVVFATFPVLEGIPNAELFFNLVFFVVITSALIQGATIDPLARRLRLTTKEPAVPRPLMEVGTIRRLGAEVLEFPVRPEDALTGRLVNELGLPRDALVNVIVRDDEALLPRGSTEVAAGDRLHSSSARTPAATSRPSSSAGASARYPAGATSASLPPRAAARSSASAPGMSPRATQQPPPPSRAPTSPARCAPAARPAAPSSCSPTAASPSPATASSPRQPPPARPLLP